MRQVEVAAAGHRDSNMWQHHIDQLLRIITLRRQTYGTEKYDFIVWKICCIDIYALLSVSGGGTFIEALLKQNVLPVPERTIPPLEFGRPVALYHLEEQPFFPDLLIINQEVLLLALHVGQIAHEFRAEATRGQFEATDEMGPKSSTVHQLTRIQNIHRLLRDSKAAWHTRYPASSTWLGGPDHPPLRVYAWAKHSFMLFRAIVIYSHTSMLPNQIGDPALCCRRTINGYATEIIQSARMIISQERFDLRFIIFPLFIAGFATDNLAEKDLAITLLKAVERHSYGGSTERVRILLETILEKQQAAILNVGNATSVGWVEEMERSGQRLIMYGM